LYTVVAVAIGANSNCTGGEDYEIGDILLFWKAKNVMALTIAQDVEILSSPPILKY